MDRNASQPVQDADRQGKPKYHTQFCDVIEEADEAVTLMSSDNIKFLVNSTSLRISSGFFQALLSLSRPMKSEAVIHCPDEDSTTIEGILRIITGKEFPNLSTMKKITPIVLTAEKWGMRGVLYILRMLLRDGRFASEAPLDLYWLGCRMKWDDVLKLASKHSCHKDVYPGPILHPSLSRLDPVDLWRLIWFHEKRRNVMLTRWVISDRTIHGSKYLLCATKKCLIRASLVHLAENYPPWYQPTRANIEQSINDIMGDVYICPGYRYETVTTILDNFASQWASLPQTA